MFQRQKKKKRRRKPKLWFSLEVMWNKQNFLCSVLVSSWRINRLKGKINVMRKLSNHVPLLDVIIINPCYHTRWKQQRTTQICINTLCMTPQKTRMSLLFFKSLLKHMVNREALLIYAKGAFSKDYFHLFAVWAHTLSHSYSVKYMQISAGIYYSTSFTKKLFAHREQGPFHKDIYCCFVTVSSMPLQPSCETPPLYKLFIPLLIEKMHSKLRQGFVRVMVLF